MNKAQLVRRTRSFLNDATAPLFRGQDIDDYMNEGIDRMVQIIPELESVTYLALDEDVPKPIPSAYHHLLAVYAGSRCSSSDQRHYEATQLMNEFETKLDELKDKIDSEEVVLVDEYGDPLFESKGPEYLVDDYFNPRRKR